MFYVVCLFLRRIFNKLEMCMKYVYDVQLANLNEIVKILTYLCIHLTYSSNCSINFFNNITDAKLKKHLRHFL